ncbi:MAG: hypothetical protein ACKVZ0_01270 [Gemmatimonadales bacterium]
MDRSSMSRRTLIGRLSASALAAGALDGLLAQPASAEQQPHMQAAKDALTSALAHLEQATSDKGGHRVAAIKATKNAIDHVEKGIRFDRRT